MRRQEGAPGLTRFGGAAEIAERQHPRRIALRREDRVGERTPVGLEEVQGTGWIARAACALGPSEESELGGETGGGGGRRLRVRLRSCPGRSRR